MMTDIVERLLNGSDDWQTSMALRRESADEIERLRNDAQPVPSRSVLAAAIHDARWPADYQLSRYAFAEEDKNGQEYCYRIADAVLAALTSAERA